MASGSEGGEGTVNIPQHSAQQPLSEILRYFKGDILVLCVQSSGLSAFLLYLFSFKENKKKDFTTFNKKGKFTFQEN